MNFFGSVEAAVGACGTGAAAVGDIACPDAGIAGAAPAGADGTPVPATPDAQAPCGGGGAGKIGIVETTRGPLLAGAGTSTGCSSRETTFSPEVPVIALAWSEPLPCALLALGTILFGPVSALMIGGSDGIIEPPNMAR